MDPKRKIIDMLNQAGGVVSGETLSAELGISRVSIWKHIKGLVQSGIPDRFFLQRLSLAP
jgi:BirA family biotin operon repressor/biotin-[acetyl-CoA-carboxylase] ligase